MVFRFPWKLVASSNERLGWHAGRMKSQQAYRDKLDAMHLMAKNQSKANGFGEQAVAAAIHVWMPDHRRRDLTNLAKQPLDAIEGVAYADDCQVERLSMELVERGSDDPRLEVRVRPL